MASNRAARLLAHLTGQKQPHEPRGALLQHTCESKTPVPMGSKFSLNEFRVDGRVACITGGSRGMGAQFARALAAIGASVIITSRTQSEVEQTAELVRQETGAKCIGVAADVSDDADCRKVISRCVEEFGGLDILINNAAICKLQTFGECSDDLLNDTLNINLKGSLLMTRAAIPELKKSGHGRIINISSIGSRLGVAEFVTYCATKAGLDGATRALAKELGPFQVTVNSILPGAMNTKLRNDAIEFMDSDEVSDESVIQMLPLHRIGDVKDLAGVVVLLASDLGSYTTGSSIVVDGGWTC